MDSVWDDCLSPEPIVIQPLPGYTDTDDMGHIGDHTAANHTGLTSTPSDHGMTIRYIIMRSIALRHAVIRRSLT